MFNKTKHITVYLDMSVYTQLAVIPHISWQFRFQN